MKFFGGEVDFNDCDSTDIDFAWPTADSLMANNGEEWEEHQRRMFEVKPLKRKKGRAA